jgi:hypothetical protein
MAAAATTTYARLTKSFSAFQGKLTSLEAKLELSVKFLQETPQSTRQFAEVIKCQASLETLEDKFSQLYTELVESAENDPAEDEAGLTAEAKIARVDSKMGAILKRTIHLQNLIGGANAVHELALEKAAPDPALPPAPRAALPKSIDALRPEKLTPDSSPVAFSSWLRQTKAWFTASKFSLASREEQLIYLLSVLDSSMEGKVKLTSDYSFDEMLTVIEEKYTGIHPRFARRFAFFHEKADKNERFVDFISRLDRIGEEADLENITVDQLYVYRLLQEVKCPDLRREFLKLSEDDLTKAKITAVSENWATVTAVEDVLKGVTDHLKGLSMGGGRGGRGNRGGRGRGRARGRGRGRGRQDQGQDARTDKGDQCFACAEFGHRKDRCDKTRNTLWCGKCQYEGHVDAVCFNSGFVAPSSRYSSRPTSPSPNRPAPGRQDSTQGPASDKPDVDKKMVFDNPNQAATSNRPYSPVGAGFTACHLMKKLAYSPVPVTAGARRRVVRKPSPPPVRLIRARSEFPLFHTEHLHCNVNDKNAGNPSAEEAENSIPAADSSEFNSANLSPTALGAALPATVHEIAGSSITATTHYIKRAQAGTIGLPPAEVELMRSANPRLTGFFYEATADTGATKSVVSLDIALKLQLKIVDVTGAATLKDAQGNQMAIEGKTTFYTRISPSRSPRRVGRVKQVEALVSSSLHHELVIGLFDLQSLGVIHPDFPNILPGYEEDDCVKGMSTEEDDEGIGLEEITEDEDNVEQYLGDIDPRVKQTILSHKSVFCKQLSPSRPTIGEPVHIELTEDAVPRANLRARPAPIHFQKEANDLVDNLVKAGVLKATNDYTEWCSPSHFVEKKSGALRLVTDFTYPNRFIKRKFHTFPGRKEIVQNLNPESKVFICLDFTSGYFQVELDEPSQMLTCTLIGNQRYVYTRAAMGLSASSDEFCYRSDAVLLGPHHIEGIHKQIDDVLIEAVDYAQLAERLDLFLLNCEAHGVSLSSTKVSVGDTVTFGGYSVSHEGVRMCAEKVAAVKNFARPESITDVRSFCGMVQQFSRWHPNLKANTTNMQKLLRRDTPFIWSDLHETEFVNLKNMMSEDSVTATYDMGKPTVIITDASKLHGLAYCLMQENPDGSMSQISCGSASLKAEWRGYSPLELELWALVWACQRESFYLRGCQLIKAFSDHMPLKRILTKDLRDCSVRVQDLRRQLSDVNVDMTYLPAVRNLFCDALSRYPVSPAEAIGVDYMAKYDYTLNKMSSGHIAAINEDPALDQYFEDGKADQEYQDTIHAIERDFSRQQVKELPIGSGPRDYLLVWEELSLIKNKDGDRLMVLDGSRLVLPRGSISRALRLLHLTHQGEVRTRAAARARFYFHNMDKSVSSMVSACGLCQEHRSSQQKATLIEDDNPPSEAMEAVNVDLFQTGTEFHIICVDRYSGFPYIKSYPKCPDTRQVISKLEAFFEFAGFPLRLKGDHGSQFTSEEFRTWCRRVGIILEHSSPYFQSANGMAERNLAGVKRLILKTREEGASSQIQLRLSEYRNMPSTSRGFISPARLFYGRQVRTASLPSLPDGLCSTDLDRRGLIASAKRDLIRDRQNRFRAERNQFDVDTRVRLQNPISGRWDMLGTIVAKRRRGRSYYIRLDDGGTFLRNEIYMKTADESGLDCFTDSVSRQALPEPAELLQLPPARVLRGSTVAQRRERRNVSFGDTTTFD